MAMKAAMKMRSISEERIPELLAELSNVGKALLSDDNGLYFANAGFHHETAEEVGVLSSEVAALGKIRIAGKKQSVYPPQAWDLRPSGQSELTSSDCLSVKPN